MSTIYLNEELSICYEAATETLEIEWFQNAELERVMQGYEKAMKLVEKYKPRKWFVDMHRRQFVSSAEIRMLFKEFLRDVLQKVNQDVFMAMILPVYTIEFDLTKYDMYGNDLMLNENFIIIQPFMYEEAAKRWLDEVLPQSLEKQICA